MRSLTIRNICNEAGISTGSFYNLFNGKDDLVAYYLRHVFTSYKRKAEEEALGHTSLERIVLIYRFYIDCVLETGLEFISGLYSSITNPVFNFLEREAEDELVLGRVKQEVEAGIAAGEIVANANVNEVLLRIAIIITGNIYYWCAFKGRIDLAYQADTMLCDYLRSIAIHKDVAFNVDPIVRTEGALL
jgi:AcrR family transcriptional regulator